MVKVFGYNIGLYVEKIKSDKSLVSEKISDYIATDIYRCLNLGNLRSGNKKNSNFFSQSWLFFCYILIKGLYGVSILFQIWFLSFSFRDEYKTDTSMDFFRMSLTYKERFPRVIFCKFDLKNLYDYQRHWVQCVLPDNVYIEKAYIIIINWLWVLFILNALSLIYYLSYILKIHRKFYINSKLNGHNHELFDMMTVDSVLALKLVNSNTYDYKITSILKSLTNIIQKAKNF